MTEKTEDKIYSELRKPFDISCYGLDTSRGFALASLRAQYIIIRLNEVLGLTNWDFKGSYEYLKDKDGNITDVLYHGVLMLNINGKQKIVEAPGSSTYKKNIGDTLKGARTDSLSKAASYVGIAEQSFCGLIDPDLIKESQQVTKMKKATEEVTKETVNVVENNRRRQVVKNNNEKPSTPTVDKTDW